MATKNPPDQQAQGHCPICGHSRDPHYRPFCSKRCADVDLARWLTGGYAIAGGDADADEDGEDALAISHLPKTAGGSDNEDA